MLRWINDRSVAITPGGADLLAVTCASSTRAGVYRVGASGSAGAVTPIGPVLPGPVVGPIVVNRLVAIPTGLEAVIVAGSGTTRRMFLATSTDGAATWTVSSPVVIGGSVRSASVDSSGMLAVVVDSASHGTAYTTTPGLPWTTLPVLPAGTTVVVAGPTGTDSTLIPTESTLTVDA